jgi:protein-disulfide isomerase
VAERKETRRDATRQRAAQRRAAEAAARAKAQQRRRRLIGAVVAAVVVVVAVVVTVVVQSQRTSTSAGAPRPGNTIENGLVIPVPAASSTGGSAPVVVNLYEDLQCPNCKNFEAQSGSTLSQLVAQGKAVLHYHEMAFLDSSANQNLSTRALNAAAVVTDVAGDAAFQKFHDLVYANQTPETGPGMTDQQLIAYAAQAGASGSQVSDAITSLKYADWVKTATEQASKDGVTGTPTVIIGGKALTDLSPSGITSAVGAAATG